MMQIVTVNLPEMFVDAIARLTRRGDFPSRSEAIRVALRDFLQREPAMVEKLLELNDQEAAKAVEKKEKKPATTAIDMRRIRTGW